MSRRTMSILFSLILLVSFGIGFGLASVYHYFSTAATQQKPVIHTAEKRDIIQAETQVVLEREYTRCGHTVISSFEPRDDINGKTVEELRQKYTPENGFSIKKDNETLVIHEKINDWCPNDKEKCRLKEYKGMVAVYKGPDTQNDYLARVTSIKVSSLPQNVQKSLREGKFEFPNEQSLNDALENLDEYL